MILKWSMSMTLILMWPWHWNSIWTLYKHWLQRRPTNCDIATDSEFDRPLNRQKIAIRSYKLKIYFGLQKTSIKDLYWPMQARFSPCSSLLWHNNQQPFYGALQAEIATIHHCFLIYCILSKAKAEICLPGDEDLQVKAILCHPFHRRARGKKAI